MEEIIEYTNRQGKKYRRPLLKGKPQICFKDSQQPIGIKFSFTCPFEICVCKQKRLSTGDARLKAEKAGTCPFQRKIKISDTFLMIPNSLNAQVDDLRESSLSRNIPLEESFPTTYRFAMSRGYSDEHFQILVKSKLPFPYEFATSWKELHEQKSPPPATAFASILRGTDCLPQDEYEDFLRIWELFNFQNLGHLLEVYNLTDVCLHSDVTCFYYERLHKVTGLFPAHFYTVSSLALQSALYNSRDPDDDSKRLFLQYLDEDVYNLFLQALNGKKII